MPGPSSFTLVSVPHDPVHAFGSFQFRTGSAGTFAAFVWCSDVAFYDALLERLNATAPLPGTSAG